LDPIHKVFLAKKDVHHLLGVRINHGLVEHTRKAFDEMFEHIDTDGDGALDLPELQKYIEEAMDKKSAAVEMLAEAVADGLELNKVHLKNVLVEQIAKYFKAADKDGNGKVSKTEFKRYIAAKEVGQFMSIKVNHGKVDKTRDHFQTLFDGIDSDGDGMLGLNEFEAFFEKLMVEKREVMGDLAAAMRLAGTTNVDATSPTKMTQAAEAFQVLVHWLIQQAQGSSHTVMAKAAAKLRKLAANNTANKVAIAQAGAIPVLLQLAQSVAKEMDEVSSVEKVIADAAGALANLASNEGNQVLIAQAGAIPVLVQLAQSDNQKAQAKAVAALRNLAANNRANQVLIAQAGAMPVLLQLAQSGEEKVRSDAAGALANLAFDIENGGTITRDGGLPVLRYLAQSGSERAKATAAAALQQILLIHSAAAAVAEAWSDGHAGGGGAIGSGGQLPLGTSPVIPITSLPPLGEPRGAQGEICNNDTSSGDNDNDASSGDDDDEYDEAEAEFARKMAAMELRRTAAHSRSPSGDAAHSRSPSMEQWQWQWQ
jgi:Ca2+-binding EF-hand superfamily protein